MYGAHSQSMGLLSRLFARYIAGEIDEPLWKKFLSALDANETKPSERMALISFMYDVLTSTTGRAYRNLQLNRLLAETAQA